MPYTASDTTISLLTCYPGSEVYELEGHSALRITLPDGCDLAINYGLFDFNSPNFLYRFVKGETDYWCGGIPADTFISHYAASGRKVVEQTINLTGKQKARAIEFIKYNLRPENATYRYNYVKDNCATRPLKVIEYAVGSELDFTTGNDNATTFRTEMRHFHANYPWYQFGIDLALGSGIDYPISTRETAFAPVTLNRLMQNATYTDASGQHVPVVAETSVLVQGPDTGAALPATPAWQTPISMSLAVLALAIYASFRQIRGHRRLHQWTDTLLFGAQGLAGLLLTFLIFVSEHEATSPNMLYFWLNPLALAGCTLVWLKSCKKALLYYHFINFALLAVMSVLWYWLPQSGNPAFIPLVAASALRSGCHIYVGNRGRNRCADNFDRHNK